MPVVSKLSDDIDLEAFFAQLDEVFPVPHQLLCHRPRCHIEGVVENMRREKRRRRINSVLPFVITTLAATVLVVAGLTTA